MKNLTINIWLDFIDTFMSEILFNVLPKFFLLTKSRNTLTLVLVSDWLHIVIGIQF